MSWENDVRELASEILDNPTASAVGYCSAHLILDSRNTLSMTQHLLTLCGELNGARRMAAYLGQPEPRRVLSGFCRRARGLANRTASLGLAVPGDELSRRLRAES